MKMIIILLLGYLLGSIPSGVWIGRLFFQKDIRKYGSGNSGTTNTFRVLGKTAGVSVLIMDILKGTLATSLPLLLHSDLPKLWVGLAAILGHTFPIFANFKGGKAVATSAGMLLGYSPLFFVYSAAIFAIFLLITSTVSLSSMISAVLITLSTFILPFIAPMILPEFDWLLSVLAICITAFIFYRHKDNIKRIKDGTENRVPFGLRKDDKKKSEK
ncbi:glycerol-3-phosphate 1-O-acyltransferase PlsY [Vagococcus elongatus]|uniref:Glycerol-3-phosphate acyltransferase n=1 Tax=Vagococcus elongatus TaxID=180344 RepID=A0A430ASL7_9ENTE|nr:glycerol-3-phosphate 1-O-acyltransferase PlsY [Vagococcus elongatus]RSU11062.1 glycerol-3-phosphate acyltransferase [Vagococcus elongatus]